jgi:hypothetical protein
VLAGQKLIYRIYRRKTMIRILWRFGREEVAFEELLGDASAAIEKLGLEDIENVSPVFSDEPEVLRNETFELPEDARDEPENDLSRYFQTYVADVPTARAIVARLAAAREQNVLEWFDLQADLGPPPPVGLPANRIQCPPDPGGPTRAWDACQVYLGPPGLTAQDPSGVDARFAWSLKGGRGDKVKIVDIEGEWLLDHEDLKGQVCCQFGRFGGNASAEAHGSAVLGVLCARPQDPPLNRLGVIGIAHRARVGVAPFVPSNGRPPNPDDVIKRVSRWLEAGDVLLLELQAARPDLQTGLNGPVLPMEAWSQARAAIQHACSKGIYVVQAAANGGVVLDLPHHGVPDDGPSIMVGAGDIVTGVALQGSNRGPRVGLQGWGSEVVTTGSSIGTFSDLQARADARRCYTRSFDGTSSAAAIVAGCVAVLSSVVRAHRPDPLTLEEMKNLLIGTGTFPRRADNQGIGPLPNLRAALTDLENRFGPFDRV